ncbi:MAG: hypothetical protein RL885_02880 [Planctomycetota bacterium]
MLLPLIAALLLSGWTESSDTDGERIQGITISTHGMGRDWGSPAFGEALDRVRTIGADWVSIHPYARIGADGSLRHWDSLDPDDPPDYWVEPIREAHRRGFKIFVKPHLAYWGSPFGWRGDIDFEKPEDRERFWADYSAWIAAVASICREADGFAVGTELDRLIGDEARWRGLIGEVRSRTDAALTYAANWTHYEEVRFWDALDVIGIQAYFPLAERAGADEAVIRAGWRKWMKQIRRSADRHNRNVVFTELGYNRSFQAPVEPWSDRSDGPEAWPVPALCYRVAFEEIDREPRVLGAFLWKWFPGRRPNGRNFQLAVPEIESVIQAAWTREGEKR